MTLADQKIDERLAERLRDGSIRLVRVAWLLSDAPARSFRRGEAMVMRRCQELPADAFVPPEEAAELLLRGNRSVLALSYGWLSAAHPDPHGATFAALRLHLQSAARSLAADAAVFVDFMCAPPPPPTCHPLSLANPPLTRLSALCSPLLASGRCRRRMRRASGPTRRRPRSAAASR